MLKEERQRNILNEVVLHNRVLLTDIAENLNVSIDTVRRDVKELDAEGKLKKVHGGAIALGFTNYTPKNVNTYALEEKSAIAEKAVRFIKEGSVIYRWRYYVFGIGKSHSFKNAAYLFYP